MNKFQTVIDAFGIGDELKQAQEHYSNDDNLLAYVRGVLDVTQSTDDGSVITSSFENKRASMVLSDILMDAARANGDDVLLSDLLDTSAIGIDKFEPSVELHKSADPGEVNCQIIGMTLQISLYVEDMIVTEETSIEDIADDNTLTKFAGIILFKDNDTISYVQATDVIEETGEIMDIESVEDFQLPESISEVLERDTEDAKN